MKAFEILSTLLLPLAVLAEDLQIPLHTGGLDHAHRVAIIGAGAAGSSAAYHLSKYAAESEHVFNITIYDVNSRAGGRTTTVNALDDPAYPVELGGSIFVKINHILYNATKEFGLSTSSGSSSRSEDSDYSLGIWDGEQFVYKQAAGSGRWSGYWDVVKLFWKYGIMAPIRTQRMSKDAVEKFLKMYNSPIFPFQDLTQAVEELDLMEYTSKTAKESLNDGGAGGAFAREIVQASTRVNYAQNLGQIHGLEGMVCMAIEGAVAVEGGNWQIFQEMVKRSQAKALFNTQVTAITAHDNNTYTVRSRKAISNKVGVDPHFDTADASFSTTTDSADFDTIIMATPLQFSHITLHPELSPSPSPIPYVNLHVTLFTSPHRLSPPFFHLADPKSVPSTILTTLPSDLDLDPELRGPDAVGPAGFWSISTLGTINPHNHPTASATQYLYKIFSPAPLRGSWLADALGFAYRNASVEDPLAEIPEEHVTWVREKAWQSYPYEMPRTSFEKVRFDWGEWEQGTGAMWYTSGIEGFISTMETSALMGRNVARLVVGEVESGEMMRKGMGAVQGAGLMEEEEGWLG